MSRLQKLLFVACGVFSGLAGAAEPFFDDPLRTEEALHLRGASLLASRVAERPCADVLPGRPLTAADVVEEKGLRQMNDTAALEQVVRDILAANPKVVEDYRGGKTNALGFLVGQCMRASKGKGNPNIMREMLEKALNG